MESTGKGPRFELAIRWSGWSLWGGGGREGERARPRKRKSASGSSGHEILFSILFSHGDQKKVFCRTGTGLYRST